MTETEAYELMKSCVREIQKRLIINLPNFQIKRVDKDGIHKLPDITVKNVDNWNRIPFFFLMKIDEW